MSETEDAVEGEDDNYTNSYLIDDDADESYDAELAEMLATVESIQLVDDHLQTTATSTPATSSKSIGNQLNTQSNQCTRLAHELTEAECRNSQILVKSPAATVPLVSASRSQDGIKTITRRALSTRSSGSSNLGAVKTAAIYEEKLLQAAMTTKTIEKLRKKVLATSPATIRSRVKFLSVPRNKSSARKFATDDEEMHCRFQSRRNDALHARTSTRDDYDDAGDRGQSFISRMEAAEKNRQKKLDLYRGENDYNARLDKKACPKCGVSQSYSEYKDKKKKCQLCGAEYRFLNAWGDIKHSFITRMDDAARSQIKKKEEIVAQVTAEATHRVSMKKTPTQLQYEKKIASKQKMQTFLDRNYTPNGDSKTKRAQIKLEAKLNAARSAK
ncbi:uncharacterized protein PHALS_13110 [Plasmopara halstedii]|uniref:Uncharacterized protein n=1 Tax=Plasmopara halstedii TaxID=4781 RepID=A0A0P1ANY9_PLAHL|nr:uncharacterized protein PHALS_13110 [Plasmopara halstedii]CEG42873.1 hypothetical protein PHALS_13110 [Plasmopara halstedii]|eukprot:XP_024579242.1 hypothetical protein PHALS_13110 [Plasmopara halstedii]